MRFMAGELLPDQADYLTDGLLLADGCLPSPTGYRPLPAAAPVPNGDLGAAPLGAFAFRANGVVHLLAGTATALRRFQTAGWADLATGLTASADIGWRFTLAGAIAIATNGADPVKKYTAATGVVANLGGTPPTARYVTVARGRVLAGYCDSEERKIGWSDEGLPESWTSAPGGPGRYTFASGGAITGVEGGEFGLVFQENAITRLTPAYGTSAWQYDELSDAIGCIAPWSLHRYGRMYRFLSSQGWMETNGASAPRPIGKEKIDRTFMALAERSFFPSMSAVTDPKTGVMFAMVPNATAPTKAFMFDPALDRWTTATFTAQRLFSGLSQSITLEGLDASFPSLDAMTTSLDDRIFQGGYPELLFFDGSNVLSALTGASQAATFTDAEREPIADRLTWLNSVRPLVDATTGVTVTVGTRDSQGGAQASSDYTTRETGGQYPTDECQQFIQTTISIAAGTTWDRYQGYVLDASDGGEP